MISFFAALQFLTVVPPIIRRPFREEELGRSVASYPLVGLLIGAMLLGADWLLSSLFPELIVAALLLAIWVLVSGGIHMDGVMDAADGLFGGKTIEQRLTIMHDERVGVFGVLAAIFVLLLKFTTLIESSGAYPVLLLAPMIGRWAMIFAIIAFPYAREQGLGSSMKNEARNSYLVFATLVAALVSFLVAGPLGLLALGLAILLIIFIARFVVGRVGGFTGDIYGATSELVELLVLLIFSVIL